MYLRDLFNNVHPVPLFSPKAAVTDNTAQVSAIIDRKGYNAGPLIILNTGTLSDADATFTTLVEHGDDPALADAAAVPDEQLLGTEALASFTFSDDGETRKIEYAGAKRYIRVTVTPANNTGNLFLSGVAILHCAAVAPTPNPPA